jgi:hypothetical protein
LAFVAWIIFLFVCGMAHYQITDQEKEVIVKSNLIMKNIYNDLWKIRDRYKDLENFGPENYSDTPELPAQYQTIKSIRLKGTSVKALKRSIFGDINFRGDLDLLYICFSDKKKAFGTLTEPISSIYVKSVGLYLLVYSTTEDRYFIYDINKIAKKNTTILE